MRCLILNGMTVLSQSNISWRSNNCLLETLITRLLLKWNIIQTYFCSVLNIIFPHTQSKSRRKGIIHRFYKKDWTPKYKYVELVNALLKTVQNHLINRQKKMVSKSWDFRKTTCKTSIVEVFFNRGHSNRSKLFHERAILWTTRQVFYQNTEAGASDPCSQFMVEYRLLICICFIISIILEILWSLLCLSIFTVRYLVYSLDYRSSIGSLY